MLLSGQAACKAQYEQYGFHDTYMYNDIILCLYMYIMYMCMKAYTLFLSRETTDASEEIKVMFVDEIFRIETRNSIDGSGENGDDDQGVTRMKKPDCDWCKDNPRRKCKHCACSVCGGKDTPDKQILCDECDMAYHLWCLSPPLDTVPDVDEW